jgi:hypothetical protein
MQMVDSLSGICEPSVENNFAKWTVLGGQDFWPNYFIGKTYEEEINYLKDWTNKRLTFLDVTFLAPNEKNTQYYEVSIWNNKEWMEKIKMKAKDRKITIEEMIIRDANYMLKRKK